MAGRPATRHACPGAAAMTAWSSSAQDVYRHGRFFDPLETAVVFLDRVARAGNLARTRLAAKLRRKLVQLCQSGRAEWMSPGLETA